MKLRDLYNKFNYLFTQSLWWGYNTVFESHYFVFLYVSFWAELLFWIDFLWNNLKFETLDILQNEKKNINKIMATYNHSLPSIIL